MLFFSVSDSLYVVSFDVVGVIAVAFTSRKEQRFKESTAPDLRPIHIVFFCFSNPYVPQV